MTEKRLSDADRLLAVFENEGSISSWEIRTRSISGNPSQRVEELRQRGCLIDPVPDTYKDPTGRTRRVVNYIFKAGPDPIRAAEYLAEAGADSSRVGAESTSAAVNCGPDQSEGDAASFAGGESSAGAVTEAPADPPRLFPVEDPKPKTISHYHAERDAA